MLFNSACIYVETPLKSPLCSMGLKRVKFSHVKWHDFKDIFFKLRLSPINVEIGTVIQLQMLNYDPACRDLQALDAC